MITASGKAPKFLVLDGERLFSVKAQTLEEAIAKYKAGQFVKLLRQAPGWIVTQFADKAGRNYITPEDVAAALKKHGKTKVRADLLAVIGKQTAYGCEDSNLCAFIAWAG